MYFLKFSGSKALNGFRINPILRLHSWECVRDARQFNARPVGFEINDETLHIPETKLAAAAAAASNSSNDEQSKLENLRRTFQEWGPIKKVWKPQTRSLRTVAGGGLRI